MSWGYKPEKKFDDILFCFDTIPAVTDGHVNAAKTALAERRTGKNFFRGIHLMDCCKYKIILVYNYQLAACL